MQSPNGSSKRLRMRATVWLVLLSIATLVPLIGFTSFSVRQISNSLRSADQERVRERAEALSASTDRQIRSMILIADAFAASPYIAEGDFAKFHQYATSVVRGKNLNAIVLDTSLRQLLNTRVPFGTPLPTNANIEAVLRAIDTRQTTVSDMFFGQVAKHMVFNVSVPVLRDGALRYLLIITAEPARIDEVLEEQKIREGWHGAVFDGNGQVVATDYEDPGKLEANILQQLMLMNPTARPTFLQVTGERSLAAGFRSPLTGWTSLAWVPERVQSAPISEMWTRLVGASLFAIASSALLAYIFWLPLATLIRRTVAVIQKVGTGEPLPPINSFLTESEEVAERLAAADRQLLQRQREQEDGARRMERSERRLRLALSVARMAIIDRNLTGESAVRIVNGAEVLGLDKPEVSPDDWSEQFLAIVHPADRLRIEELRRRAEVTAGPFSYDFRIVKPGDEIAWIEAKGESIGENGAPTRIVKTAMDITARKQSEQSLRLVSRELTHRAKNLMTVILGIATQTARTNVSLDQFLQDFSRRIEGLGKSHDLLMQSNWSGAPLSDVVAAQLATFGGIDGKRIRAEGPHIVLKNDVLQSLGLAFHELGTNAVKYGALSKTAGSVEIAWGIEEIEGRQKLRLTWSESGGPPVKQPTRKGFGHVITVRSLARVVSGEANIDFAKTGIVWKVEAPLEAVALDPSAVSSE